VETHWREAWRQILAECHLFRFFLVVESGEWGVGRQSADGIVETFVLEQGCCSLGWVERFTFNITIQEKINDIQEFDNNIPGIAFNQCSEFDIKVVIYIK
jgi:hypothetical protein